MDSQLTLMLCFMRRYKMWKSVTRARGRANGQPNINISSSAKPQPVPLWSFYYFLVFFFTSNCQCAACKSCFAWSAAQPAVRTNWLIMTWCLSSSIFDEVRVLLAATGSETDFRPFFLSFFSRVVFRSPASVVHHYSRLSKHKYLL